MLEHNAGVPTERLAEVQSISVVPDAPPQGGYVHAIKRSVDNIGLYACHSSQIVDVGHAVRWERLYFAIESISFGPFIQRHSHVYSLDRNRSMLHIYLSGASFSYSNTSEPLIDSMSR